MRISLPEQIWIDLEPAAFGSRALAYAFDATLRWTATAAIVLVVVFGAYYFGLDDEAAAAFDALRATAGSTQTVIAALLVLLLFALHWTYPIYFEVLRSGVTPGKALLGLRVVDESGLAITFRTSLLRTMMTVIDILPVFGLTALCSTAATKKSQRLGDIAAGTMVIYSGRRGEKGEQELTAARSHTTDITLPLELYNVIEKYIQRRADLAKAARESTLAAILQAVRDLCRSVEVPMLISLDQKERWLLRLYQRAKPSKLGQSATRLPSDQDVRWRSIHQEIGHYERELAALETADALPINRLHAAAGAYQELCQRYAHLATFYPHTSAATRAARAVRNGRRLIYGNRLSALNEAALPPFLTRVSDAFRTMRGHCLAAASIAVIGGLLCAVLIQINPAIAWRFLTEEVVESVRQGHLWTEQVQGQSSLASAFIMTNNIKVAVLAYALGITGGIGTCLLMLFNGVHIGGIFAALSLYDMSAPLVDFIVAHGVLELSVIAVAGGCGLFLGDALLAPGPLTRRQALQQRARVTVELIIFNTLCLIVAGLVEGFISPYAWIPFPVKLSLGLILGAIYWSLLWGCGLRRSSCRSRSRRR